jgi:hypothetical protein
MKRGQEYATGEATLTRGHAWHAYADPASPGVMTGDTPFGSDDPPGPDRAPTGTPDRVVTFWLVGKNTPGINNDHDGHSYLVLTERPELPPVVAGWFIEPARLDEGFQLDQRGDRWVRLVRILTRPRPTGARFRSASSRWTARSPG